MYPAWPGQRPRGQDWGWLLVCLLSCGLLLAPAFGGFGGCIYFILPALLLLDFRVPEGGVYLVLLIVVAAIVALTGEIEDVEQLFEVADRSLYAAKARGRDCCVTHSQPTRGSKGLFEG